MTIKVGDFVYISKDSEYYNIDPTNPGNRIGVVVELDEEDTIVDWGILQKYVFKDRISSFTTCCERN
ncbi:hypothetical protein [Proteus phage PM2]|uniref:Uncharacterized protein n=1 Tax=Proteus phage PM2 TaxID=2025809 RepID=A0A249XWZ6_9CAUD|nr:hypothetical protein KNT71_gp123 [Proteus phage PM2]ASZ76509.1 hypothetical protein [Proteus phage PM2]